MNYKSMSLCFMLALPLLVACHSLAGDGSDLEVASQLKIRMHREQALAILGQGGRLQTQSLNRPVGGDWAEAISNNRLLGELRHAEALQAVPVAQVLEVHRETEEGQSSVFHLFLDAQDLLVGFHFRHIN